MITVRHEKGNMTTRIMEVHLDEYTSKGWKVVDAEKQQLGEFEEIAEQTIKASGGKAAKERGRNHVAPEEEAVAIVATELRKEKEKQFTDGLIKE